MTLCHPVELTFEDPFVRVYLPTAYTFTYICVYMQSVRTVSAKTVELTFAMPFGKLYPPTVYTYIYVYVHMQGVSARTIQLTFEIPLKKF